MRENRHFILRVVTVDKLIRLALVQYDENQRSERGQSDEEEH